MLNALGGLTHRIDTFLYKRGYRLPEVRNAIRNQILLCGFSLLAGIALAPVSLWVLWFGVGAVIATYCLLTLARFIQQGMLEGWSRQLMWGLLFRFYGRLLLTGLLLFGMIVWLKVPISALVAGLATNMVTLFVCMLLRKRTEQNIKEA